MILDGVSNDNKIAWNLNHHQFISKRTYPYSFLFLTFLAFIKKIHCWDWQNNPLSSGPHPKSKCVYNLAILKCYN
jgi:hypothetical protein